MSLSEFLYDATCICLAEVRSQELTTHNIRQCDIRLRYGNLSNRIVGLLIINHCSVVSQEIWRQK